MTNTVAVAVIIPTYNRGLAITSVLEKIQECNPRPAELYVHIDCADGKLEGELARRFPSVNVLTSPRRLGPGGGRHRCLQVCSTPYAVSFDDDSYPVDADFFGRVVQLFAEHPRAAIFGASIWYPHEREKAAGRESRPHPELYRLRLRHSGGCVPPGPRVSAAARSLRHGGNGPEHATLRGWLGHLRSRRFAGLSRH